MTSEIEIRRGLQGVYIDRSKSSFIDGTEGKLLYRGYSIHDLAEKSSFEEIAYLLLYGELPNKTQLQDFDSNLRSSRSIPAEVIEIIRVVKDSHPMDVLRTAVSALSAYDKEVADNSVEATIRKGIRLTAQAPTIVTTHARIKEGKDPVSPNANLNQAANFLYMLLESIFQYHYQTHRILWELIVDHLLNKLLHNSHFVIVHHSNQNNAPY